MSEMVLITDEMGQVIINKMTPAQRKKARISEPRATKDTAIKSGNTVTPKTEKK